MTKTASIHRAIAVSASSLFLILDVSDCIRRAGTQRWLHARFCQSHGLVNAASSFRNFSKIPYRHAADVQTPARRIQQSRDVSGGLAGAPSQHVATAVMPHHVTVR
jgi:hypothetical protein